MGKADLQGKAPPETEAGRGAGDVTRTRDINLGNRRPFPVSPTLSPDSRCKKSTPKRVVTPTRVTHYNRVLQRPIIKEMSPGQWSVDYGTVGGLRLRTSATSEEGALQAAERLRQRGLRLIEDGHHLTAKRRIAAAAAFDELERAGVEVPTVILVQATKQWIARQPKRDGSDCPLRLAEDLKKEMVARAKAEKKSLNDARNVGSICRAFGRAFQGRAIASISWKEIDLYLEKVSPTDKAYNYKKNKLSRLFTYAVRKHLIERNPIFGHVGRRTKRGKIHFLSIGRGEKLFRFVNENHPEILPAWATVAFCGARIEDAILPQNSARETATRWEDFNWENNTLYVRLDAAAKGRARQAPIGPALRALLLKHAPDGINSKGLICPGTSEKQGWQIAAECRLALRDLGFNFQEKDRNILRHSYATYRSPQLDHKLSLLAAEMGNSDKTLLSNYLNMATPAEAEAWFLLPEKLAAK